MGNRERSTFYARPVIRPHPGRFSLGDHKDRTLRCGVNNRSCMNRISIMGGAYVRAVREPPLRGNHDISNNQPCPTTRISTIAVPFIRLRNDDYSQAGAYFVTICTQHRECLFGPSNNYA
ncbi:MAG: hypothetical protein WBM35_15985 [Candidatus Electrothrix sp.]